MGDLYPRLLDGLIDNPSIKISLLRDNNEPILYPNIKMKSTLSLPVGIDVFTDIGSVSLTDLIPNFHTIQGHKIVSITHQYNRSKVLVNVLVFLEKSYYDL
jgi:hypothetical protein